MNELFAKCHCYRNKSSIHGKKQAVLLMGNMLDTLREIPPTSMRNDLKSALFCHKTMRNTYLEIISHRLSI